MSCRHCADVSFIHNQIKNNFIQKLDETQSHDNS
jgi:hypothetical protein